VPVTVASGRWYPENKIYYTRDSYFKDCRLGVLPRSSVDATWSYYKLNMKRSLARALKSKGLRDGSIRIDWSSLAFRFVDELRDGDYRVPLHRHVIHGSPTTSPTGGQTLTPRKYWKISGVIKLWKYDGVQTIGSPTLKRIESAEMCKLVDRALAVRNGHRASTRFTILFGHVSDDDMIGCMSE
jgi:hypothetical protein